MTRIVVIYDELNNAINNALDKAIEKCPGAEKERENLYQQLLMYFDEHGVLPDFSIKSSLEV